MLPSNHTEAMNTERIRTVVTAAFVGVGAIGGAFGGWTVLNAILNASLQTQFLLAIGGLAAGATAGYASLRK